MTPPAEVSPLELVVRAPRILSLCAGIGGIELGIKLATDHAARVVCICEGEAYCAAVLRARMQDGYLDDCPIWTDLRTFDSSPWRGVVDCIIGGFPCQPFSLSGQRRGSEDPRHMWPHIVRHIEAIRPAACFFENVTGLFTLGFEQVCQDLQRLGYHVEAGIFSAEECGASHQRQRLFFFAYADGMLLRDSKGAVGASRLPTESANHGIKGDVADAYSHRLQSECITCEHQQKIAAPGRICADVADANHNDRRIQCSRRQPMGRTDHSLHSQGQQSVCGTAHSRETVANADVEGQLQRCDVVSESGGRPSDSRSQMAHADEQRFPQRQSLRGDHGPQCKAPQRDGDASLGTDTGSTLSGLGRTLDGPAQGLDFNFWPRDWENGTPRVAVDQEHRIDRLRALGNAVVPATAALAWRTLTAQAIKAACAPATD